MAEEIKKKSAETEPTALFYRGDSTGSDFFRIPFLWTTKDGTVIAGIDTNFGSTGDSADNIDTAIRRKKYLSDRSPLEGWTDAFIPDELHMRDYADEPGYKQKSASFIDGMILQDERTGRIHLMIDAWAWNGGGFQYMNVDKNGSSNKRVGRSVSLGDGFATIGNRKYLLLSSRNKKADGNGQIGNLNGNTDRSQFDYAADVYGKRNAAGRYNVYHVIGIPAPYSSGVPVDDGNLSLGELSDYSLDENYVLYRNGLLMTVLQKSSLTEYPITRVPMRIFYEDSELQMYNTSYIMQLYSDDDGASWHTNKIVSGMFKRENSNMCLAAPGRGIQLKNGVSAGRLLFPVYYQREKLCPEVIYSDDNGESWKNGETVPSSLSLSESALVELPDGAVMMFMRNTGQSGGKLVCAVSTNGGETWGDVRSAFGDDGEGMDCQLSAIVYEGPSAGDPAPLTLLLSTPCDRARKNGKIFVGLICKDKNEIHGYGKYRIDWKYQYEVTAKDVLFGYSCMTELPDGAIGILYETSSTPNWVDGLTSIHYKEFRVEMNEKGIEFHSRLQET